MTAYLGAAWRLKLWKRPADLARLAQAWGAWIFLAFGAALGCSKWLGGLPGAHGSWGMAWAALDWQLDLWFLATAPAFSAACVDFMGDEGWARTKLAFLLGWAFAPALLGAFPQGQWMAMALPFAALAAASKFWPGSTLGLARGLAVLCGLEAVLLVHGIWIPPFWMTSVALAWLLGAGLAPDGRGLRQGLFGALGALVWQNLRPEFFGGFSPYVASLISCGAVALGWLASSLTRKYAA